MLSQTVKIVFRSFVIFTCLHAFKFTFLITKYTPQPNPYTRFGWNFRKITYCNLQILFWNFLFLLCAQLLKSARLSEIANKLFINLTRPLSITLVIGIWFCFLVDLPLITWISGERWIPRWLGHTYCTFPAFVTFFESFLQSHNSSGFTKAFKTLFKAAILILSWQLFLWLLDGQTPNLPKIFLYVWWKQLLIYLILFLSSQIAISVGYLIDWGMFDEPKEDRMSRKIEKIEAKNSDIESESEFPEN